MIAQQMERTDAADGKRGREIGGRYRVHQPVGEARIEDDLPPGAGGHELAIFGNRISDRGMHPAVDAENPEGRDGGADCDQTSCGQVQAGADLVAAEQHDAKEARLKEKRGQNLVGHQGADDGAGLVGEDRPVGSELVGHDDAGDDAHGEGHGEYLHPVMEEADIAFLAGDVVQPVQNGEIAGEPDGEGGEDEMEAHREGELKTCQECRVPALKHDDLLRASLVPRSLGLCINAHMPARLHVELMRRFVRG